MKPREKLETFGIQSLSDQELITLILGRGTKKESVFQSSRRIVQKFDHEELVNTDTPTEFMKNFQMGYTQSAQLIAVFELGKRYFKKEHHHIFFRTAQQVYEHVKSMATLQKEHLRGLYLDSRHKLMYEETLSIGGLNSIQLHPREVFRPAIERNAYAIILVHNHPSGDPSPSDEDKITMEKLSRAADVLQIPLLDHLIIGKSSYRSLKEL